jgi:hypothetical protein
VVVIERSRFFRVQFHGRGYLCFSSFIRNRRGDRLISGFLGLYQLFCILLASRDDHGLLEFILLRLGSLVIRKTKLMMTDGNHVAMLQRVFLDQLAINVGAVGAVQVLGLSIRTSLSGRRPIV